MQEVPDRHPAMGWASLSVICQIQNRKCQSRRRNSSVRPSIPAQRNYRGKLSQLSSGSPSLRREGKRFLGKSLLMNFLRIKPSRCCSHHSHAIRRFVLNKRRASEWPDSWQAEIKFLNTFPTEGPGPYYPVSCFSLYLTGWERTDWGTATPWSGPHIRSSHRFVALPKNSRGIRDVIQEFLLLEKPQGSRLSDHHRHNNRDFLLCW